MSTANAKYWGCILGPAIGDAKGAPGGGSRTAEWVRRIENGERIEVLVERLGAAFGHQP